MKHRKLFFGTLSVLVVLNVGLWAGRNQLLDWSALQTYTAPSAVSKLVTDTGMTPKAKNYFYVNHPVIESRTEFNKHCPNDSEQSVVLGCFLGNRMGIYLFDVTDSELQGVEQVTAAHEMLHQAYQRLSVGERKRIDGLLQNYYSTLQDQDIKQQIELYKKSEPNALNDEMHSLFGTEAANLPSDLEQYYAQYFTKRSTVTDLYNSYQSAFTKRKAQIAAYDAQLSQLQPELDSLETSLDRQNAALDTLQSQMDAYKTAHNYTAYNALVDSYNAKANAYNRDLATLKDKINTYNGIVAQRNQIALEEQTLQEHLSSKLQTTTTQ